MSAARRTRPTLAAALAALLAIGCGNEDDDASAAEENEGNDPSAPLDGEWLIACHADDPDAPERGYEVLALAISASEATLRDLDYEDASCATPSEPAETVTTAAIVYPGGVTETARGPAMHVDITPRGIVADGEAPTPEERRQLDALGFFDTRHDIALVDGEALYFGDIDDERDGSSPGARPDTLERTPFLRR